MSFLGFILGMAIGAAGYAFIRSLIHVAPKQTPGIIEVSHWAIATRTPMVSVSVTSDNRGSLGVFTYLANARGEARATLYSQNLARITGLELVDHRPPETRIKGLTK